MKNSSNLKNMKIAVRNFSFSYDSQPALKDITLDIFANEIFTVIGPARSGKTTFLRCLNRMNDTISNIQRSGQVLLDGDDVFADDVDIAELRRRLGMVFAVPICLPKSIYNNLALGPRMRGIHRKKRLDEIVERSLKSAYLWEEVKDRLHSSARNLSGGQQQRLCLARAMALEPEVLLLDEPCSGLDPVSTRKIEEALLELKKQYTIILVTNITGQAARVGDRTAFFLMGELIECDLTEKIFTNPRDHRTSDYITGKFG
jgi:phosphate transport system ATP-binding protein